MKKYLEAIKKVTWPKEKNVGNYFIITMITIIVLVMIIIASDTMISALFSLLYA